MVVWERFRQKKLREMSKSCSRVLDFGQSVRGDKKMFSADVYETCDYDITSKPDIVGDICDLNMIKNQSYDGVICCSILEHVYEPFKGVFEIGRIMKPEGMLFGFVPFIHSYHASPGHYEDYYRFTEAGIRYLLKDFSLVEICPVQGNLTTFIDLLPSRISHIKNYFFWADRFFSGKQVLGYNFFARK